MPDGSTPEPDRIPPHNLDAEAAVLSTLFLCPDTPVPLEPEQYYSDANAWIARAISAVGRDAVLVAHWLREQKRLGQVGGQPYLLQVIDATPAVANMAAHAELVRECWRRRVLIRAMQQVTAELYSGETTAADAWRRVKLACSSE